MSDQPKTDHAPLHDRLKRRREEFGATLHDVERWSGISADRITDLEAGNPMDALEYETLCRGLAIDGGALARGEGRNPRRSVARFRAQATTLNPQDLRVLALASELGRIGGFLATSLGRAIPLSDLQEPRPVSASEATWKQGYRLGENARHRLTIPPGPIQDIECRLFDAGIHVARIEFATPELEAASLWERHALPIILINVGSIKPDYSLTRRSLLAHELCHLLHDTGDRDLVTQLSWSEGTGNYSDAVEQRARGFAPAFLAPRDEVRSWFQAGVGRRYVKPMSKVVALAKRWGFSLRGAVWHAKNCKIISPAQAEELSKMAFDGNHPWNSQFEIWSSDTLTDLVDDPEFQVAPIAKGLIAKLAWEAADAGVISRGRCREILSWK